MESDTQVETQSENQAEDSHKSAAETKALTSLLKAIKSVGLYPEGSPVPEKITGAFAADLALCFEDAEEVQVTFRSSGVQLGSTLVPAGSDESWDLPLALFEIGLRDLAFLKNVTPGEIYALVRLLSCAARRELDPAEEDLSVCLWEMDLPGISYRIAEVGDEADAAAEFDSAERGAEDDEIREMWDSLHPIERYRRSEDTPARISGDDAAVSVGERETDTLLRAAKREQTAMGRKLILVLLELVLHDLPAPEFERVQALLPDFFIRLLAEGQFRSFLRLSTRLLDRIEKLREQERRLDGVGPMVLGESAAQAALGALRAGRCDDPQAAELILVSLDPAGLLLVLEEAIEGGRGPGKAELRPIPGRVIVRALSRRPDDLFALPERLTPEQMRHLAGAVDGRLGRDAAAWDARLRPLLESDDPEIRLRALEMLAAVGPASLEERLLTALDDAESRVRHFAVERLSQRFGERSFAALRRAIEADSFAEKDFEEQATFYEALARSSPDEALPILERIVRRRSWLAPKSWRVEKACALRGLGQVPAEAAMALLMRHRKSRDPLLAAATREALAVQHRRSRTAAETAAPEPSEIDGQAPEGAQTETSGETDMAQAA
ncbi:MAG: hypothetical protein GF330_02660 [Candidatus Eisenbacteria bacterium]|nr:hypothetical protein [Candidatus Eisenbacteria bacterium]